MNYNDTYSMFRVLIMIGDLPDIKMPLADSNGD